MSDIDPEKMKVVELRSALAEHGLDTKGNKPVLVARLKSFLESQGSGTETPAATEAEPAAAEGKILSSSAKK